MKIAQYQRIFVVCFQGSEIALKLSDEIYFSLYFLNILESSLMFLIFYINVVQIDMNDVVAHSFNTKSILG